MEITPIGWLLIPLGVLFSFVYPAGLYTLTIFFVPFTATSILNSGSGETGAGIQPFMFFGLLLLLRDLSLIIGHMKFQFPAQLRRPFVLYALFILVCGISLFMPMVINGAVNVPSSGSLTATIAPLVFDIGRLKPFLGLVFGLLLTACIARRNMTLSSLVGTAKIYLASGIFVCFWGLFQLALYFANVSYPYMIFNNSASVNAQGYQAVLDSIAMRRISSVALEPSTLAITIIGMMPLVVIPIISKIRIFGKYSDILIATLLAVTLVLTTSSTGFIGLGSLCLLLPFAISGHGRLRRRVLTALVVLTLVILATYATVPLVRDFMEVTIFAKSSSFSALERWVVVYIDFQYFLKYPFLGLGWGSAPTHDTIAGILSNCGLLGLISFATLIGWIIRRLWNQLNPHASSPFVGVISGAMFLSICCTMVAYLCSSLPGGGVFYLISGLAIAACGLGSNSSPEDRQVTIINKT